MHHHTILFLGGSGFLGSNVLAAYRAFEGAVKKPLRFIVTGRGVHRMDQGLLPAEVEYVQMDYTEKQEVEQVFAKYSIDEVFHFISATVPANSNHNIRHDIETNLIGTVSVLECIAQKGVNRITYLSSGGAIYGDTLLRTFQEQDFNIPNNSYGIIKLTIEKYIHLFHKLYNIDYLILRVSNPFGYYHKSTQNGLINIALRKAARGETLSVWGDGRNTKDYIFAEDFAHIFWTLYQKGVKNQILNIGSGQLYSILDILTAIRKILPDMQWTFESAKSFDTRNVAFSLDALQKIMPLHHTDFQEALRRTWEWEKAQLSRTAPNAPNP
jgi:UDP-glucose 4-epimerase